MRIRLSAFFIISAVLCVIAAAGQARLETETGDKDSQQLDFEAPKFQFKSLDEMNIIIYSGDSANPVKAWQLDVELQANTATYNTKTTEARFHGNAVFKDSLRQLNADTLIYYNDTRNAVAVGNVVVTEKGRMFRAGKVKYHKDERLIEAMDYVYVHDDSVRSTITGASAVFNDSTRYGLVNGSPVMVREDEIGSIIMISCDDTLEIDKVNKTVRLWENVVITKDSLTVKSVRALYDDSSEVISLSGNPVAEMITINSPDNAESPLQMFSTVTGDSMRVFLSERKVTGVDVIGGAHSTTVSTDSTGSLFDRSIMDSSAMRLAMQDNLVSVVTAEGRASSYYHRAKIDNQEGMFINEAEGDTIYFFFDEGVISQMRISGFGGTGARGKYYRYKPAPEDSLKTKETETVRSETLN
ncbi:MAG: hypothetical protein JXB48_24100 [Candidatus Latescibacteria bacterium]|nr:hypothetical protein [Candidatus Latescibacterota bacterium]